VTKSVGLDENNQRFSFAAAWEDFDGDGDLDLLVANDFGRKNLYRCDRHADGCVRFKDVAAAAGVEDISAGMSAAWGDADNDGRPDIYVSNMWSSAGNRVAWQRRFHPDASPEALASFQRHARGNSLFQNAGDGTFYDVSEPAGVTVGRWAWGSRFVDLNNDGREDLVVANGYVTQTDPGDL
jgi:FG-GAP-like repeat